jgi:hypothetical protein
MNSDEAHRRAEALFKKEQQSREAQQATAEYDAEQRAVQERTARLRALRLARDAANQGGNRTRHGERQQGVHHVNVHGSLTSPLIVHW